MAHYCVVQYFNVHYICSTKNDQNISSEFSSNSEATASELLENFKEIFPCYQSVDHEQMIVWILLSMWRFRNRKYNRVTSC